MGRISRYSLFVLFFLFLSGCANDLGPREKVSTFHFFVQFLDSEQMPKEGMPVSLSLKFQNQTLGVVSAKTISNGSSGLVIEIRYRNEPTFEFYATYVEDGLQKEQRFVYVITDKTEFKEVVIDPSRASKNRITSTNSSLLTLIAINREGIILKNRKISIQAFEGNEFSPPISQQEAYTNSDGKITFSIPLASGDGGDLLIKAKSIDEGIPLESEIKYSIAGDSHLEHISEIMPNLPPDHMYRIRVKDQFGKTLEGVPVDVSYQCDSSGSVILKSDKSGLAEFQCNPSWSDNKYYHYRSIVEVKLDGLDKESSNLIKVKKQVVGKQYEMEEINLVKIIPILRSYQIKAVDIEGNPISGTSVSYHISGLDSRDMSGVKLTDDKGVVLVIAEFENELSKWTPSKIKFATNRNGYYDSYGDLTNSWDGVSENGQTEKITVVMKSYKDYVDYKLQNLSKLVETERFKKLILHFQSLSAFLGFGLEENKEGNYFKIKLFQPVDKVSSNEYLASASLARDAVIPTLKFIENEFGFEQIFKYFDGVYFDINQGGLAFGYFIPSSDVNGFINLDITQQELLDASLVIYNGGRIKIELKK